MKGRTYTFFRLPTTILILLSILCGHIVLLTTKPALAAGQADLLLHMDGADASTTFTMTCPGATATASGNAQIDTAQSKFGGASALFDGTGDYVSISNSSRWDFGTDNFTVDFWVRFNSNTGDQTFISGGSSGDWMIGKATGGELQIGRSLIAWDSISTAQTWTNGTWYHVEITRSGSTLKMFKDGTEIFSGTNSNTYNITSSLLIASRESSFYLNGWMDEVRVIKGYADHTAAFTAPTQPYSGCNPGPSKQTILGGNGNDIRFQDNLTIIGAISKGAGTFAIDHPLDPENKILYHSFVESPDVKNIYDGVVTLDTNGEAVVQLPDYYEALNKDYRYQYSAFGQPAPGLYIKERIKDNKFTIAGGPPKAKVSWQVTGIRHDPYILKYPIITEVDKGPEALVDVGEFLFEGYASSTL
jgi:hypothetical protein